MPSHITFQQRLERVLLELAENKKLTPHQRLDATRQLTSLKRAKPPRVRPKPKSKAMEGQNSTAFGSK
jgi:hypothetical protein